jgi:phosphatidylserine/phosphatidylglycerophosphate/cardiolipin synthase-like enzyme
MRTRLPCALYAAAALALTGCAATTSTPSATSATSTQPAEPGSTPVIHASPHHSGSASITSRLALITEPQDGIAPVLSAVKGARREVDMVMYEDNDTKLDSALAADAHRGVTVRVLLNGGYYGRGFPQDQAAYNYLEAHVVPVRWTPSYFALTHQKTLIIDGRAYILTFNLTPQYYPSSRDFGVIDTNAADDAAIEQTFNADWTGQRTTAPGGHDLVWSPGSQAAQVKLIESAAGWVDIYYPGLQMGYAA